MAVTSYIKFSNPTITGEATEAGHAGEVKVLSWSHSFNQPTPAMPRSNGDGGTPQQANHADFSFSKYLDTATDDLLKYCWNGKTIGKAVLTCFRSDAGDDATLYLQVDMEDVIVSNVSLGGGQGDLPTENISLAYGKITYTYNSQETGTENAHQASHDLVAQEVS